ncbi:MAG: hypothetical protein U9Q63_02600 [Patescibacteria group bacterium]|nr:hypothetical protein [Patescibacteria group bacterium]
MSNTPPVQNQAQPTTLPLTPKKKKPWLLITVVVLLLGVIGVLGYKYYQLKQQTDKEQSQIQSVESPTPKLTITKKPYTENTNVSNQKKYVNPEFGISFLYLTIDAFDNKTKFTTKEIGSKFYIYPEEHSYETGQYIEVFEKDPNKTLEQTIKTTFLENYSEEKCAIHIEELSSQYPTSYIKAIIKVPGEFTDMQEMSEKARECPKTYTQFGGSAYFLMDQKHSDKFAFFSIGQYGIAANKDNVMWQDTIEFTD